MTKHVIEWFTAFDGTLFMHQDDCMDYELNYLYHKSGYRFYKDGNVLSDLPEDLASVDSWDYYLLEENPNNDTFVSYANDNYGYLLGTEDWPGPGENSLEHFKKHFYYN